MDKTRLAYRALTGLFIVGIVPGALLDIVQPEPIHEIVAKLELPLHLLTLLGVWKLLGAAALARPSMSRLNEWAYAGFFFDLTGAVYLHSAVGDFGGAVPAAVLAGVLIGSYVLRNKAALASEASTPAAETEPSGAVGAAA